MSAPRRILLVDREEKVREALAALLAAEGYDVAAVADGEAALAAAEAVPPDLLIIDLAEAALRGFQLLRNLRAREAGATLPVLVLSSSPALPAAEELARRQLSTLSFLPKQTEGQSLVARVALMLGGERPLDERPVLVVDDDRANLELIERRLEVEGYATVLVETGQAAIEAVKAQHFQAVLLDLRLPDRSGLDVLAIVRQYASELPVLIMTAHGSEALAVKTLTAGADDYLIKPLSRRELLAALRNAVERRRLQGENLRMQRSLAETVLALQESLSATERSRQRLETLMEAFDAGVVLLDAAGSIERANGAARRMFRAEAATDLPGLLAAVREAIGEDGQPIDLGARLMEEAHLDTEAVVRWTDGGESALLIAAKPITGGDGLPAGRLVAFRDVTGRHQRRGKLEALLEQLSSQVETGDTLRAAEVQHATAEAERVKNQILSAVSHELRTPLNFIVGFGSVLADGIAGELTPEQFRLVEKMLSGAERLTATVDDLLNYAMLTSGMLQASSQPLDLAALTREVEGFMRAEAENKGVALKAQLEEGPEAPRGDAAFVKHIVRHLVGNAIKFTAPGGSVTLRSGGGPDEAWVEVEDTGIGIAPEILPRLFDRFYQAESSPTRRFGGTGMGLALARGLAELMGARIEVESEPGRGSRFRLTFSTLGCSNGDGQSL